jgi:hypothetical protein
MINRLESWPHWAAGLYALSATYLALAGWRHWWPLNDGEPK